MYKYYKILPLLLMLIRAQEEPSFFHKKIEWQKISTYTQYALIGLHMLYSWKNSLDSIEYLKFTAPLDQLCNNTSHNINFSTLPEDIASLPAKFGLNPADFTYTLTDRHFYGSIDTRNTITLSSSFFDLPMELCISVLKFIIGHELAHKVYGDIGNGSFIKFYCLTLLSQYVIKKSISCIMERFIHPTSFFHKYLQRTEQLIHFIQKNPLIGYIFTLYIDAAYNRYCEKRADLLSLATTDAQMGGLYACAGFAAEEDYAKKRASKTILGSLLFYIQSFFHSHPTGAERLEYIKNFKTS